MYNKNNSPSVIDILGIMEYTRLNYKSIDSYLSHENFLVLTNLSRKAYHYMS